MIAQYPSPITTLLLHLRLGDHHGIANGKIVRDGTRAAAVELDLP